MTVLAVPLYTYSYGGTPIAKQASFLCLVYITSRRSRVVCSGDNVLLSLIFREDIFASLFASPLSLFYRYFAWPSPSIVPRNLPLPA